MSFVSTIISIWLITFAFKRCESISCNLPQAQYNTLKSIYFESAGEGWYVPKHETKWTFPSAVNAPCQDNWAGLICVCDIQKDQYDITSVFLPDYNMQGKISMSIGNLSSLEYLNLSSNTLEGEIPISTYQLSILNTLDLHSNQLIGSISSEIRQLTSLVYLYLNSNMLIGSIPSEIGQLSLLVHLDLYNNNLAGSIPSNIGKLSSLVQLDLFYNMLTGTIPTEIGQLTSLEYLEIYSNMLTGTIPSEIRQLTLLAELLLQNNELTGSISSDIGHLTSLANIFLDSNMLTGSIPSEIGQLTLLVDLILFSNMLTGSIPSEIGQLSSLVDLYLELNMLTGSIPSEIGQLSSLVELYLESNKMTGSIPSEIGQLSSLVHLMLYNNTLIGSIPSTIGQLTLLEYLYLYSNMLIGSIPSEIGQLSSLVRLYLYSNKLTGSIPKEIGELSINTLYLYSNLLTGTIPLEIGQLLSLAYLALDSNMLTGFMPSEIGRLSLLVNFDLDTNMLTGSIPSEIGQLSLLSYLTLYMNSFTGLIPSEIGLLSSLTELYLYSNKLTGTIPSSLGNVLNLEQLDLNSNLITGTIPPDMGQLIKLSSLLIYSNSLSGSIPSSLSSLKRIETLYLFNNLLTLSIPASLGKLSTLLHLCLQSNMISSTIPDSLSNLKDLQVICLDDNIISGTFPSSLIGLLKLSQISLSNNLLSGNFFSSFVSNYLTVLNVANNIFTGSITDDIFDLSLRLSTVIASGNCIIGSIPNSVCNVMNILTLFDFSNSGGNSLCRENQHVQSLRPSFVHGTFSQLGLTGTIPSCLLQSSTMTALKLSGNKLQGTISSNPANISTSLRNLTLANNALTGSIPTWIQLHSFLELDLSNNRLDGTLSSDFTVASDQTTLSLAVNRLSGPLPHSIVASSVNMSSLNVLASNIFDCSNNDLPALDPSSASYTCGSGDLDISAYTWLVCVGFFVVVTIIIVAAIYWYPMLLDLVSVCEVVDILKLWRYNYTKHHNTSNNYPEVVSFIMLSRFITMAVFFIVSICLFAAFPLFVGLHADYAIVSYDYGYVLSIAYLHGIAPVVAVSCLLAVILLVAAVFIPSLIEYIAKIRICEQTIKNSGLLALPFTTVAFIKLYKGFSWVMFRSYLIFLLLNLFNIVVVMTINISYVATLAHRVNYNRIELLAIQVSVGLFKVVWNTYYVAWSCDWLASFFTHRGSMRSRYVMSIVNFIVAPVISTIVYNESCFYYVFNNRNQAVSSVALTVAYFETCNNTLFITCFRIISININSQSSSSFVYSYACGSALLVAYTPVFFSSALFYGLFQQMSRVLLAFDNPNRIAQELKNLPKRLFVRLSTTDNTSIKDLQQIEMTSIRVKGRDIIVRLMVHMTIMLTFGLASPILIIPLAFAVIMDCQVSQLLVGKCIYENDNMQAKKIDAVAGMQGTNQNPANENQLNIAGGNMSNFTMPVVQSTMKADLLIMEHLDMQSSWQGLDVCFYPMIMFVMLFWALLFFDMIADEYGTIHGIIVMTCFAVLPSVFSIAIIKSKAMTRITPYLGLTRSFNVCVANASTEFININALKLPVNKNIALDVELSLREIGDAQGDIQLNPINQLPTDSAA